jgi:drug/metabolite transporter (DMT)-like permease
MTVLDVVGVARFRWEAALLATAAIWGATYVLVHDAVADMAPSAFLAYRFTAAALLLAPACLSTSRRPRMSTVVAGALLGCVLFCAYGLQTVGLQYTGASQAAFVTGLMVVFTPLLGTVLLRQRLRAGPVVAAVSAVPGSALLTLSAVEPNIGDLYVLGCALAFAVHLLLLGHQTARHNPWQLTVVQLATVGLLSLLWSGAAGELAMPHSATAWTALLVTAILASAVAFVIQTAAQRVVSPAGTALILTMEPVFAALTGQLTGERVEPHRWAGAALVLTSMLACATHQPAPSRPARAGFTRGENLADELAPAADADFVEDPLSHTGPARPAARTRSRHRRQR